MGPHHVRAELAHKCEILLGTRGLRVTFAARVGLKRPIRNAARAELAIAFEKEFPPSRQASHRDELIANNQWAQRGCVSRRIRRPIEAIQASAMVSSAARPGLIFLPTWES